MTKKDQRCREINIPDSHGGTPDVSEVQVEVVDHTVFHSSDMEASKRQGKVQ